MSSGEDSGSSLDLNSDIDSAGEQPDSYHDDGVGGGGAVGGGEGAFFGRELEVDEVVSEVSGGMENGAEEDVYLEYTDDQVFVDLFGATEMDAVDVGVRVMDNEEYGEDGLYMNHVQGLQDVHFETGLQEDRREVCGDGDAREKIEAYSGNAADGNFERTVFPVDDKLKEGLDGYLKLGFDSMAGGGVEINEEQPNIFHGSSAGFLDENPPIVSEQHVEEGGSHILDGSVSEINRSEVADIIGYDMVGSDDMGVNDLNEEGYTAFTSEKKDTLVSGDENLMNEQDDFTANFNDARDLTFCNTDNVNTNSTNDNQSAGGGSVEGGDIMNRDESACINLLDQPSTLFVEKSASHLSQSVQTEFSALAPHFLSLEVSCQEEDSFQRSSGSRETLKMPDNEIAIVDVGSVGGDEIQAEQDAGVGSVGGDEIQAEQDAVGVGSVGGDDIQTEQDAVRVGSVGGNEIQAEQDAVGGTEKKVEDAVRMTYCLPSKEGDDLSVSDLVWGKVKSHPWWPGQIFDASCASEIALKYEKKDRHLVAYFWDKKFAWCEPSQLRPFQKYFTEMENQSTSELFANAVNDALNEVSRRIELGMTCSCLSTESLVDAKKVENAGIQEGTCNLLVDKCSIVNDFQPKSLLEFIQSIAQFPTGTVGRLDLVILKAQLMSFYIRKGYHELPVFLPCGYCLEDALAFTLCDDAKLSDHVIYSTQSQPSLISPVKKKRGRKKKSDKEKNFLEGNINEGDSFKLVDEDMSSYHANDSTSVSLAETTTKTCISSSVRKRKTVNSDPFNARHCNRKGGVLLENMEPKPQPLTPNGSFKVGEWICRAASQITRSPPILEPCSATFQRTGPKLENSAVDDFADDLSLYTPVENRRRRMVKSDYSFHLDELLSQLCLAARNPMKGYSFVSCVVSFFTRFKNSCCSYVTEKRAAQVGRKRGRKRKLNSEDLSIPASDAFTYDYMNDSFWSDMIFNNSSELNEPKREEGSQMQRPNKRRKPAEHIDDFGPNIIFETENAEECVQKEESEMGRRKRRKLEATKPLKHDIPSRNLAQERLAERPVIILDEKIVDECTPTELILDFNKPDSIPSETYLIRMFSRYGPLKEAETEVLKEKCCAKVVFKKRMDACRAFSSSGKFSVFGPTLVSYKLKCSISRPQEPLKTFTDSIGEASTLSKSSSADFVSTQDETTILSPGVPAQVETESVAIADRADAKAGAMAAADSVHLGNRVAKIVPQAPMGVPKTAQSEIEALEVRDSAEAFSGAGETDSRTAELVMDLAPCERSAQLSGGGYPDIIPLETAGSADIGPSYVAGSGKLSHGPAEEQDGSS